MKRDGVDASIYFGQCTLYYPLQKKITPWQKHHQCLAKQLGTHCPLAIEKSCFNNIKKMKRNYLHLEMADCA